jgi:hypothetical protein
LPNGGPTTGGGTSGAAGCGAITAAPIGGPTTAGGGWLGQMKIRSPDGSMRGGCQLAQPLIVAVK